MRLKNSIRDKITSNSLHKVLVYSYFSLIIFFSSISTNSLTLFNSTDFLNYLAFVDSTLHRGFFWTTLTHPFYNNDNLSFFITLSAFFILIPRLFKLMGTHFLLRFILAHSLTVAFTSFLFGNISQPLSGSLNLSLCLFLVFTYFIPELKTKDTRKSISLRFVCFCFVFFDLLTVESSLRIDNGSIVASLGGYLFSLWYLNHHFNFNSSIRNSQMLDSKFTQNKQSVKESAQLTIAWNQIPLNKPSKNDSSQEINSLNEDKIDSILDKINEFGLDSLNEQEKKILEDASASRNNNKN